MNIIEMVLDESSEKQGIHAVSVVESPAIEENWIALNKQLIELKSVDEEKKILMGAGLVPDKQIYRRDKDNGEFYIYFSKETIRKASELFLKRSNQNNATYEHQMKIEGMSVVESWIIEDTKLDKSAIYGFELPVGTWMISMKVDNPEVWDKVKAGEIKGFSIEGYFEPAEAKLSTDKSDEELLNEILNILNA
jgi:hypothetical protein